MKKCDFQIAYITEEGSQNLLLTLFNNLFLNLENPNRILSYHPAFVTHDQIEAYYHEVLDWIEDNPFTDHLCTIFEIDEDEIKKKIRKICLEKLLLLSRDF